jgi:DNA mismatch repair ATPase MutS
MFLTPLCTSEEINQRSSIIALFETNNIEFPYNAELFDAAEFYLSNTDSRTRLSRHEDNLERKFKSITGTDVNYKQIKKGIESILEILQKTDKLVTTLLSLEHNENSTKFIQELRQISECPEFEEAKKLKPRARLNYATMADLDKTLRFKNISTTKRLLSQIYLTDIYITVAGIKKKHNFSFAKASSDKSTGIKISELFHPLLENPVPNSVEITPDGNVIFLTGANMAGKSTFMKSLGIAAYLAHMGFPVPAQEMTFDVLEGIFTTINLPDNMCMGYSHFYAEVMRVKKVAESISKSRRLLVIFDELFRGTNVKDAYDATVAVTKAFATINNSFFVISTHIIEAGETLEKQCANIRFLYLPTEMQGNTPVYSYKLQQGITADRHGMLIIRNERIPDILNQ